MKTEIRKVFVTIAVLLVLIVPINMNQVLPLQAQTNGTEEDEDTSTNTASQDYQDFQSCLSSTKVDGYVSEQQIRDCFDLIYNTGTGTSTSGDSTISTDSPPAGDEDTESNTENTRSEDEEQGANSEEP
jgi:hypothetical protein